MPDYAVVSAQEMDAAAALLQLHCSPQPQETKPAFNHCEGRAEMTIGRGRAIPEGDVTAPKFINRLSVKVTSTPLKSQDTNIQCPMRPISPRVIRVIAPFSKNNGYIFKKKFRASLPAHKNIHDMYLEEKRRWFEIRNNNAEYTKSTRDVGTQTDEDETHKEAEIKLEKLTELIKELEEKLRVQETVQIKDSIKFYKDADSLENDDNEPSTILSTRRFSKRKTKSSTSTVKEELNSDEDYVADEDVGTDDDNEIEEKEFCRNTVRRQSNGGNKEKMVKEELNSDEDYVADEDVGTDDDNEIEEKEFCRNTVRRQSNCGNKEKMVPIGCGNATVAARVLRQVNWNSYTSATRKLLSAVFPRSILATHSLTGKPSPAFPNKPAKKKLNPALVDDIIQTVVQNCRVPESIVRTSITTKCADESKMLRNRHRKRKTSRVSRKENEPIVSTSSSATSR